MIRRIARTEFLRGVAAPFTLAMSALSLWLLIQMPGWVGNWTGLAAFLRSELVGGWPIVVAFGAWVGGRDRRHGMGELTHSTPRPRWHPILAAWLALTAGAFAVLGITWSAGAAFVAPIATYSSGNWPLSLLVCLSMLSAGAALGIAIGRRVPWDLTAPLVGLSALVVTLLVRKTGVGFLVPSVNSTAAASLYPLTVNTAQFAWFIAITAACLLMSARALRRAAVAAVVASVPMTFLLTYPPEKYYEYDSVALQSVCTPPGIQVCTPRFTEYLVDDYIRLREPVQARLRGVSHVPARIEYSSFPTEPHQAPLVAGRMTLTGDFAYPVSTRSRMISDLVNYGRPCDNHSEAQEVAFAWISRDFSDRSHDPVVRTKLAALREASPQEQRAWMSRFFAANRSCDDEALNALMSTPVEPGRNGP